jgi:hypothetical protein
MTLKRSALLIMSPDEGDNLLPGVSVDEKNWKQYLRSATGGAWSESEIMVLRNPTPFVVAATLLQMRGADYSFIAFSGHGEAISEDETRLHVHPKHSVSSRSLKTDSDKQTLILDCCRMPVKTAIFEASAERKLAMDSAPDLTLARFRFDAELDAAAKFHATLNSCSVGETAGESDATGGFYTSALMRVARQVTRNSVMGIKTAHLGAKTIVQQRRSTQTPTAELPRSTPTFPFAVGV